MNSRVAERFWGRVEVRGPDECWPWKAHRNPKGYGLFWDGRKTTTAPRVAAELSGMPPGDLFVCHRCDNPPCCNPRHLFLGDSFANQADCARKGRRKHLVGERHQRARLTAADVEQMRTMRANGVSALAIAKQFGVSKATVSHATLGRNWKSNPPSDAQLAAMNEQARRIRPNATGKPKLTAEQAAEIKAARAAGVPGRELAQKYGVHECTISAVVRGRNWKSVA